MSSLTESALERWGRAVGETAVARRALPLVMALRGPLGAGKSVLARAIARGAGVAAPMPSPTYNLRFSYEGLEGVEIDHLDLYRLEEPDDVWELGWETLGDGDQIVLIEWPERVEELLPNDRWDIVLSFAAPGRGPADTLRRLELERRGGAPDIPPPPNLVAAPEP